MSRIKSRTQFTMFLIAIIAMVLTACGPTATTAPAATTVPEATSAPAATTAPEATSAPAATTAPEATTAPDAGPVERKDILVIPSNVNIPAPDIWNPYIPGHLHPAGDEPEHDGAPLHVEL